jgi:HSP20 family molecular chaperone IbpA
MTRYLDLPFLLGFEQTRDLIERTQRAGAESYPPYNVEERDGGAIRISLAVAGFSAAQLTVSVEANELVVSGRRDGEEGAPKPDAERAFLHRGIAARGFTRTFVLADGLKVDGAALEHGLLHIDLVRPEPQSLVRNIPITTAG